MFPVVDRRYSVEAAAEGEGAPPAEGEAHGAQAQEAGGAGDGDGTLLWQRFAQRAVHAACLAAGPTLLMPLQLCEFEMASEARPALLGSWGPKLPSPPQDSNEPFCMLNRHRGLTLPRPTAAPTATRLRACF